MKQSKKQTRKEIIKFFLRHPLTNLKSLIAIRKASDIELTALWYYSKQELDRRGIK